MLKHIEWNGRNLRFLDQTRLPLEEYFIETADYRVVAEAIRKLQLRGAPLIGVSAAYGVCLGAIEALGDSRERFFASLEKVDEELRSTRPTAVNLFWALDRMKRIWQTLQARDEAPQKVVEELLEEAHHIAREDEETNEKIARYGAQLFQDGDRILTHCNAGALACSAWGTALGAITWAFVKEGKRVVVYADETRPLLQGARLTAFELWKNDIPVRVICDNMAGFLMARREIDKVIVGADRVARNGDFANKIGTYTVALLAHYHRIPFYVAAPLSSFDPQSPDGSHIPIEERNPEEVLVFNGRRIAPCEVGAKNPAFDVTPGHLVTAFITERGIIRPPYKEHFESLFAQEGG